MASSFITRSLEIENITTGSLNEFFDANDVQISQYNHQLSQLIQLMASKGGTKDLVMFLSGMGGTGKSEVIKAFIYFAKNISILFGWNYDTDVIKVTALTGAAACEIPDGRTLHSQACLPSTKITKSNIES